jgi:hypothetical protein
MIDNAFSHSKYPSCHQVTFLLSYFFCRFIWNQSFFSLSLQADKIKNPYDPVSRYTKRPIVSAQHPAHRKVAGRCGEGNYGQGCCKTNHPQQAPVAL